MKSWLVQMMMPGLDSKVIVSLKTRQTKIYGSNKAELRTLGSTRGLLPAAHRDMSRQQREGV